MATVDDLIPADGRSWIDILKPERDDAHVAYLGGFLRGRDAERALRDAAREEYVQERITIHGRSHDIPRLTMWYSSDGSTYTYSGIAMEPRPFPPFIRDMRDRIEQEHELSFNSVLVNVYRDGQDGVGWHSDDEQELGDEIDIASVSLGAERDFLMRRRRHPSPGSRRGRPISIRLGHGSLLVMRHPTQRHWEHRLPPRSAVAARRYNLTFRSISN